MSSPLMPPLPAAAAGGCVGSLRVRKRPEIPSVPVDRELRGASADVLRGRPAGTPLGEGRVQSTLLLDAPALSL